MCQGLNTERLTFHINNKNDNKRYFFVNKRSKSRECNIDTIRLKPNNLSRKWGWNFPTCAEGNASGKKMLVVSYFRSHNNESASSYFHASKHLR